MKVKRTFTPEQQAKRKANSREWEKANPERKAATAKKYNSKPEVAARQNANRLARATGVPRSVIEKLREDSLGFCAVCGVHESTTFRRHAVDHDHTTSLPRGVLCYACNISLGHLKESPARIRALADYIERHQQGNP